MGECCVEFCNNSSIKGYMKIFPTDRERRAIWAKNVARKDWMSTNNSYLCEFKYYISKVIIIKLGMYY
ncbi:hypothetical protein ALC60_13479 [Trachymyrmex zeteki]|uniref:THAP-type domain-containing protein n=1 Tax=Mycetomoellerius zeteki TaxID=64791 RepID=A0A151WI85_9HYME|nr:hypothetical protein ALC60_13479 [Trachymyrmex zeteki]